jgi:subtilisin family serine protease
MWSIRLARRYLLHFLICACALVPAVAPAQDSTPPAAVLPEQAADAATLALMAARARHAPLALYAPTAWPEALSQGQATDVKFTVLLAGGAASAQPEVRLYISGFDTSLPMLDDGLGPDLSAGDRIYSALFPFSAADAEAGRCYDARVSALSTSEQTMLSGVRRVCVSRFRVGIDASNVSASNVVLFSEGNVTGRVVADEALMRVRPELGDDRIEAIAALVDGTVVGSLPGANTYQIRLSQSQTSDGLRQTLQRLRRAGGVLFAEPNGVGGLQTPSVVPVTTSDPELVANNQPGLDRIKARQAWALTTGDVTHMIAVIDTGANFNHPDFWVTPAGTDTRFYTSGGNLVAADCTGAITDPSQLTLPCPLVTHTTACHAANTCNADMGVTADIDGHGTRTAGLIGVATNNALGMAGVTWQGSLYVVKIADSDATVTGGKLAHGMYFASSQGASILSISIATPVGGLTLCNAVTAVDGAGRLVVAAAGNTGDTSTMYPASCAGALAVGNSTTSGPDDVLYNPGVPGGSNYAPWVSVAAPGVNVLSPDALGGYTTVTGTSFSTPIVAGAAALVLSKAPFGYTNAQLRTLLHDTGVPLVGTGSHINRIDALAALLTFNTAPTAINLSGLCVLENTDSTAGASVGTLTTVDADAGTTGFEYTIVGGADQAKFSVGGVNADQLVITDGVLNFETQASYAVTVRSTDVGNLFFEQDLLVAVCNINEPPIVADTTTFALPENSPAATVVGTLVASDPEGVAPAFAITAGNTGSAFAISGTGEITVANGLALDFETTPVFTLTVTVSDGMNTLPVTVTVNLTDINEPPTITGATFTIPENSPAATVVGTLVASDPEGLLTLTITAGNVGGAFAISGTGVITVANSTALDFETMPVFTLTVTAADGVTSVPAPVVVNLTNDTTEPIPNPILVFSHKEIDTVDGIVFDRYRFTVANYLAYPAEMFAPRPDLPPCGLNTEASQTWVDFFNSADNSRFYGFCALGQPSDLNLIWFAVPTGTPPPAQVYIKLIDRGTNIEYQSNSVAVPFP